MEWLNMLSRKWYQLCEKLRPAWEKTKAFCAKAWEKVSAVGKYMFRLRAILLALPVAVAAVVLAVVNTNKLDSVVQITKVSLDIGAEESLFGCLVVGMDYVARDVAVLGPLVLTICCLILTMCSKRTFYPWLISVFSLALPLVLLLTNIFP